MKYYLKVSTENSKKLNERNFTLYNRGNYFSSNWYYINLTANSYVYEIPKGKEYMIFEDLDELLEYNKKIAFDRQKDELLSDIKFYIGNFNYETNIKLNDLHFIYDENGNIVDLKIN